MLFLASDHAGFALKERLTAHLRKKGVAFKDLGTHSEDSVDYPDFAFALGQHVAKSPENRGIGICGTGIGICMAANKIPGIRAAMVYSLETAKLARQHNDANVACFGGRTQKPADVVKWMDAFLSTPPDSAKRHHRRAEKVTRAQPR
ncbi:RpiB/LacA/LacB family sugar-phosphate isomerase [Candidatus Micrarchaeota archaeon]|nr:RpiB/LacA/LacB family sugar-phosphate isomerase [Candidatus Micrarchaeota archaeon]